MLGKVPLVAVVGGTYMMVMMMMMIVMVMMIPHKRMSNLLCLYL